MKVDRDAGPSYSWNEAKLGMSRPGLAPILTGDCGRWGGHV